MWENVRSSNFSLISRKEQPKVTWSQVGTVQEMDQTLEVLLLQEGHSDHGLVGFAQFWDPLFNSGTVDGIPFSITSSIHMADEANADLFMVVARINGRAADFTQ